MTHLYQESLLGLTDKITMSLPFPILPELILIQGLF